MRLVQKLFLYLLPLFLICLVWELIVSTEKRLLFLYSSPTQILLMGITELQTLIFWQHIGLTALEAVLGLLLGMLLGTSVGFIFWVSPSLAKISKPYIVLAGSIPVFALAPLFIMWFGVGLLSKAIMAAFAVFFVALTQAYDGAHYSSDKFLNYARTIKASNWQQLKLIVLPGALCWVLNGFKLNVSVALLGAFISEFISSEAGLGYYILKSTSLYDTTRVFLGLLVLALLALSANSLAWLVEQRWARYFRA